MTETRETPLLRLLVGEALRGYRSAQGRTLRDVAAAARVSVPYLSEVERGRKEASSEVLAAVCRGLDVPLSDVLEQVRRELVTREARPRDARAGIGFVPGPPLRLVRASADDTTAADSLALVGAAGDAARPTAELPDAEADAVPETAADGGSVVAGPTCLAGGPHPAKGGHPRQARRRPGQGRPDGVPPGQLRAPVIPLPQRSAIVA